MLDRPSGQSIGPYDILEPLGRGGMGVVHRALHRDLGQYRAIKILPPHLAMDEEFVARFKREATIAAGLRHPNIVLIYDVGQTGQVHYIVMDLVSGRSLRDVIHEDHPLPMARVIKLLRPLADALDFAHARGVIHRDVKPTNAIVGKDDHVTLLDFGIARANDSSHQLTRAGLIVGTPEYMAPEVVTGTPASASADLYALGIVAYEMLTGHVPFTGGNTASVAFAHVNTQPPSPRADRADLPEAAERVLLRQIAKDPADRFPNASSFVDALEQAVRQSGGQVSTADPRSSETMIVPPSLQPSRPGPRPSPPPDDDEPPTPMPRVSAYTPPRPAPPPAAAPPMQPPGTPPPQPTAVSGPAPVYGPGVSSAPRQVSPGVRAGDGPPPTPPRPADEPGGRKPWLIPVVAVVALALVGVGVLQLRGALFPGTSTSSTKPTPQTAAQATPTTVTGPTPAPAAQAGPTAAASSPGPTTSPGAIASIEEARAALTAGDFPRAIELGTQVKQRSPSTPGIDDLLVQAYLDQGQALLQRGDADGSLSAFAEALKLRPNDPQAVDGQRRANLASLRRRAETAAGSDPEAAIAALEQLLQIEAGDADARTKLYGLLIAKGDRLKDADSVQSQAALRRALELDPGRPEARERLATFTISAVNAARVQQVSRWGKGTLNQVAYAPGGKLIALASSYGVYLYDASSRAEVRFLETGTFVWDVAFSPDGQEIAGADDRGAVRLWKVADSSEVRTLTGHEGPVLSVAYAPDGQSLVTGSADRTARVWRRSDGSARLVLRGHEGPIRDATFTADSQRIATASEDKTARLWSAADGSIQAVFQGHTDVVTSVAVAPDGQTVATASQDQTARLWRAGDGGLLRTLAGHTGWVLGAAFSPDGQTVVTASADNTARYWRADDGSPLRRLQGHTSWVVSAAMAGDGQTVATASRDGTVRFWRLPDGATVGTLEGFSSLVRGVAISPDGQVIAAGLDNGSIQLLKASDGSALRTLSGHTNAVYAVAFSPDSQTLASGSDDQSIRLWRVADGSAIRTLSGHADWVRALQFAKDGQTLVSGSADKTARVWRVADGASTLILGPHEAGVSSLALTPDGTMLATGTADRAIRLWRLGEQSPAMLLNGHTNWVNGLSMSADGRTLASASADKSVRLWHLPDGAQTRALEGHSAEATSVVLTADGQTVISTGWDTTVRIWRAVDGAQARVLEGHTNDVNSAAIAPDGQTLVTGSSDGTIRLWGVR